MIQRSASTRSVKLSLHLLGPPQISWQGQPFALARRQARALLYCLADELQPVPRDRLIFLLWPDTPDATARRNLIRLLSYLHNALPHPNLLLTTKTAVALNPDLVESDAVRFAKLGATGDSTSWETAVSFYRSRFLDGFTLADSLEFDQWLSQTQRQYERTYLDTLRKLVKVKNDSRDLTAAIHYAQKYLASDDLAEAIHRHLITLYAASGDRSAALRQFEQCTVILERELGVPPLPETRAAYEAARDGTQPPPPEALPKPEWTTLPGLDLPLVGRDDAWQALTGAYRRYQSGGVIFISGEAGVGKSRLMQEFATAQSGLVLTGNSHATGQALPYQPLVQALRLALPLRERWSHILPIWLAEVSRLLPELHPHFPDLPPPVEVAPQQAQARLFEALSEVFASLATDSPLLLCLDDVHWADEATLGWLEYTTNRLTGRGMCILATYRVHEAKGLAEWQRALNRAGHSANIRLTGLTETAVTNLLLKAGVDQRAAAPLATRIHTATGGNAFFVLETIRELLETGTLLDDVTDLPLPPTVRDAVLRRAARLTPLTQQIVTVAAVLSPHLRVETLVEVSGRGELETVESVEQLLTHQVLQADGQAFRFQHDLARQTIYEDISPWRQRLLHRRAAEGLEHLYQADLAPFYPSLAHHWSRVVEDERVDPALVSKAVEYLQKAGEQAVYSSANEEAIDNFNKAIVLVQRLPNTIGRDRQELGLQIALGNMLKGTKGFAAPEMEDAFSRAYDLYQHTNLNNKRLLFQILGGLATRYYVGAKLHPALEVARQMLELAQLAQQPIQLIWVHFLMGEILFSLGDIPAAQSHIEQDLTFYDPQRASRIAHQAGQDPAAALLTTGIRVLWLRGYPNQARKKKQEALALANQMNHPFTWCFAAYFGAMLDQFECMVPQVYEQAEAIIKLGTEHKFPWVIALSTILQGWALCESSRIGAGTVTKKITGQQQLEIGIAQMQRGLRIYQETGSKILRPYLLALLAEVYLYLRQFEPAQTTLAEALAMVAETGERFWEAELYRLKGDILLRQGDNTESETCFQHAIEIARQQSAKSLELRATVSLARLWHSQGSQGKQAEAHHMLSEIYNWFSEGFDTVDLKAAKALLEELV